MLDELSGKVVPVFFRIPFSRILNNLAVCVAELEDREENLSFLADPQSREGLKNLSRLAGAAVGRLPDWRSTMDSLS